MFIFGLDMHHSESLLRFIRFEAGSAIKASTRAGVGWLIRRDSDLGMIHGLLHPLESLLRLRVAVLVGMKLLHQTAIVLVELSLVHLLHALKNHLLRSAQEFVNEIDLVFLKSLIVVSHIFLSQLACCHIYCLFSISHCHVASETVAVSNLIVHSCFGFAEHFFLLLSKIGVVCLFLFEHLNLSIFSLFLSTLVTWNWAATKAAVVANLN